MRLIITNIWFKALSLVLLSASVAACGSVSSSTQTNQADQSAQYDLNASKQNATLVFWSNSGDMEAQFNQKVGDSVRKKFPNYTIQYISSRDNGRLSNLLTTGTQIDIYYDSIVGFQGDVKQAGWQFDMSDLIKKAALDMSRYDPTTINAMKQLANGGIYGLPVWADELVLYYNKDIFDKFGVTYPKNGMTWNQLLDLSNQLTKNDGGNQYLGLSVDTTKMLRLNPYSLSYLDPKTDLAAINTNPKWRELYQLAFVDEAQSQEYQQEIKQLKDSMPYATEFVQTQNLAMLLTPTNLIEGSKYTDPMTKINWDMVSIPTFPDQPGIGSQLDPVYFGITSTCKNQDAAMEVLKYLSTDEFQADEAKIGIMPVVGSQSVKQQLGQNSAFKGKNYNALFYNKPAPISEKSQYDGNAEKYYNGMIPQLTEGVVDINSALRTAEDQTNKAITTAKSSSGN
ncbi:MAG: extracellular solute-binding protein family 1 [Bacilli bacterium]|nr:extracellular solute-binding protein family 1 [Bacilli bacterium]